MDIVQLGALERLIKRDERQGPLDDIEAEDGVIVPDLLPGQRATSDPRESVQPEAGPSNANAVAGPSRLTTPAPTSTTAPITPSAADDEEDPANLSPTSKSRLRKRLWMRRKRAAAKGEVADLSRTLFKPGRKASAVRGAAKMKGKGKANTGQGEEEIDEDEEEGEDEDTATRATARRKPNAPSSGEDGEQDVDDKEEDGDDEDQEAGATRPKKRAWQERRAKGHSGGRTKPYKCALSSL